MTEMRVPRPVWDGRRSKVSTESLLRAVERVVPAPLDHYTRTLLAEVRTAVVGADELDVAYDEPRKTVVLSGDIAVARPTTLAHFPEIETSRRRIGIRIR